MARASADSSVFHAIADPTRRAILDLLRSGEQTVSDLMEKLAPPPTRPPRPSRTPRPPKSPSRRRRTSTLPHISQSAFSQHLAVLRSAGLVESNKSGRLRVYSIRPAPLRQVVDWIALYDAFWTDRLDRLGEFLDRTTSTSADDAGAAS